MQPGMDNNRFLPDIILYRQCRACSSSDWYDDASHKTSGRNFRSDHGKHYRPYTYQMGKSKTVDLMDCNPNGTWTGSDVQCAVRTEQRRKDGLCGHYLYSDGSCYLYRM